jgi:hypothetical protein
VKLAFSMAQARCGRQHVSNQPTHSPEMKITHRLASLATISALSLACSSGAFAVELLTNGSFEAAGPNFNPGGSDGSYCYMNFPGPQPLNCGSVPGWSGNAALIKASSLPWYNPSGLGNWGNTAKGDVLVGLQNFSALTQAVTLLAGTYTLSWTDAGRGGPHDTNSYNVFWDATQLNAASFTTLNSQAWSSHSLTFTAAGAGVLKFQGTGPGPDGTSFIDTVSLTSVVPEPEGYGLALAGAAVLVAGARRRKRG